MQSRPARETLETSQLLENEEERRGEERRGEERRGEYSTVQYSTVQYDVKNVTEGRREEGDQARFFTWMEDHAVPWKVMCRTVMASIF